MSSALIDCRKRITDSLIGKDMEILDSVQRLPESARDVLDYGMVTGAINLRCARSCMRTDSRILST